MLSSLLAFLVVYLLYVGGMAFTLTTEEAALLLLSLLSWEMLLLLLWRCGIRQMGETSILLLLTKVEPEMKINVT